MEKADNETRTKQARSAKHPSKRADGDLVTNLPTTWKKDIAKEIALAMKQWSGTSAQGGLETTKATRRDEPQNAEAWHDQLPADVMHTIPPPPPTREDHTKTEVPDEEERRRNAGKRRRDSGSDGGPDRDRPLDKDSTRERDQSRPRGNTPDKTRAKRRKREPATTRDSNDVSRYRPWSRSRSTKQV